MALGTSSSGVNGGYQVLIDKTGDFMYVSNSFSHDITQFSVPSSGGTPTALSPPIVPSAPNGTLVNTWIGAGP
jgi:6-phosphogluconolactonase (cycloisomerase 2 family)